MNFFNSRAYLQLKRQDLTVYAAYTVSSQSGLEGSATMNFNVLYGISVISGPSFLLGAGAISYLSFDIHRGVS